MWQASHVKVKGQLEIPFRTVEKEGNTEYLLAARRDMKAAKHFFQKRN